jgi:predicted SAM-dependent methyltransferase
LVKKCNICGSENFREYNRRVDAVCTGCGSFERTRLFWLHLNRRKISRNSRILHIAPERCIYNLLKERVEPGQYTVADIEPEKYNFATDIVRIDLQDLDNFPSNEFDYILHNHVLEHVPCSYAYTLFHLHRMLKATGLHLFSVPFMRGYYDETYQDIGDEARIKRFGQNDHVRRFGADDVQKHLGKVIRLPEVYDAERDFKAEVLESANVPRAFWAGYNGSTVLSLGKEDYLLR